MRFHLIATILALGTLSMSQAETTIPVPAQLTTITSPAPFASMISAEQRAAVLPAAAKAQGKASLTVEDQPPTCFDVCANTSGYFWQACMFTCAWVGGGGGEGGLSALPADGPVKTIPRFARQIRNP